jgi:hypothetical protein
MNLIRRFLFYNGNSSAKLEVKIRLSKSGINSKNDLQPSPFHKYMKNSPFQELSHFSSKLDPM